MADDIAQSLKEMAKHRGFKLVKSRRRKPGAGDFGKFGLTDDKGKELIGFGREGLLTASAEDIESYLRVGALNTWQQSARITPDKPSPRAKRDLVAEEARPAIRPRAKRGTAPAPPRATAASSSQTRPNAKSGTPRGGHEGPPRTKPKLEIVRSAPVLALRPAKPSDAAQVARLLSQLSGTAPDAKTVARNLANLRKAGGDMHLAEFGIVAGCIGWSVIVTPHRGNIGRITLLVVDEAHRRRGFGAKLLGLAEATLAKRGCILLEAMSDIDIRNSHNFFRAQNFDQTSYRFARAIGKPAKAQTEKA
ncbi:GNAT family N-acetyltransferase [Novosphingobium sp. JCM 18896]|uniref:GNAT family N-acetyltransferase n=1 Tax=Novosphingobium sp. JCM 18896 TaxID=2989731 RepID=UPI0022239869|nr:GNAT family N-acetyltransferase [Novosphingobium sp. JCM 18896]MCW1432211.1 GNAT family N-acetyltransferase [Novosphingobium sp. JCM 18896]